MIKINSCETVHYVYLRQDEYTEVLVTENKI